MKSYLLLMLGLLLVSITSNAQRDPAIYPVGYASKLQDVHVDNTGKGYAGGSCGVLLYSGGNATNWQLVDGPASNDGDTYTSVACAPAGCATSAMVVVGNKDLYRSRNGGSWQAIDTEANSGNVHWLTDDLVFTSAGGETARRSTNGGNSWQGITLPEIRFSNFYFVDASKGFFGSATKIYTTADGGSNWTATGYEHPTSIRLITWLDENTGFIYDSQRDIYRSTDGGVTFTKRNADRLPANFVWFEALSADRVLGGAVVSVIQESLDGGVTWTRSSPAGASRFNPGVHRRGNDLFTANSANQIFHLAEGAVDWVNLNENPSGRIEEISFATPMVGYAAANGTPNLIKTTDAGLTWTPTGTQLRTFSIKALSANELVIISSSGPQISRDGGNSFVEYLPQGTIPDDESLTDVFLKPNGEFYLHGPDYSVTVSADGNTFTPRAHNLSFSPSELYFMDDDFGVVFSRSDQVATTQDGGANWSMVASPGRNLTGAFFIDKQNGWLSNASTRYVTADGGTTWASGITTAGGYDYRSSSVNGHIYASEWNGNNGLLMRSTDDGETWSAVANACFGHRAGEITPDGKYYFTGGDGGFIVRHDLEAITPVRSPRAVNVSRLKVYPNPTDGQLTVELPENTNAGSIELFDASGRMLRAESVSFSGPTYQMNIQGLPAGVYQLRFTSSQGVLGISRIVLR